MTRDESDLPPDIVVMLQNTTHGSHQNNGNGSVRFPKSDTPLTVATSPPFHRSSIEPPKPPRALPHRRSHRKLPKVAARSREQPRNSRLEQARFAGFLTHYHLGFAPHGSLYKFPTVKTARQPPDLPLTCAKLAWIVDLDRPHPATASIGLPMA